MFETCYKYPQCTVFVTCFVYLLLFTYIVPHCDFLSCLSTALYTMLGCFNPNLGQKWTNPNNELKM